MSSEEDELDSAGSDAEAEDTEEVSSGGLFSKFGALKVEGLDEKDEDVDHTDEDEEQEDASDDED
jgi:hypothetical protein